MRETRLMSKTKNTDETRRLAKIAANDAKYKAIIALLGGTAPWGLYTSVLNHPELSAAQIAARWKA